MAVFRYSVFDSVLSAQVLPDKCILDGELVVWNRKKEAFEAFNGLKTTIKAAASPETKPDQQLEVPSATGACSEPCFGDLEIWCKAVGVLAMPSCTGGGVLWCYCTDSATGLC